MLPSPTSLNPTKLGNHPITRVTTAPPFHFTGMDYCGPFTARVSQLRRASQLKIYLSVFIYFTTKAAHLEVAQDLSTNAFLDVLQRFISSQGAPLHLYSDCGNKFLKMEFQCLVPQVVDKNKCGEKPSNHFFAKAFHLSIRSTKSIR